MTLSKRTGLGLCLSGGGYRASLFHLGSLRRLHELGILQNTATISSVSGGSIISAHLADRMVAHQLATPDFPDWDEQVAAPFRQFVAKDLRTRLVLKHLLLLVSDTKSDLRLEQL